MNESSLKTHKKLIKDGKKLLADTTLNNCLKKLIKEEIKNSQNLVDVFEANTITYKKFCFPDNLGNKITIYKCFVNDQCIGKISNSSSQHPWECEFQGVSLGLFFKKISKAKIALEEKIKLG